MPRSFPLPPDKRLRMNDRNEVLDGGAHRLPKFQEPVPFFRGDLDPLRQLRAQDAVLGEDVLEMADDFVVATTGPNQGKGPRGVLYETDS